jgi:hypothetical protein
MTKKTKKLLSNYEKACIELADEFLTKYFDCVTEYTDPTSWARFVADDIGGILDAGSDVAFFNMGDIIQVLKINPTREFPYKYCCDMLEKGEGKWENFKYWYSQQK